MDEKKSQDVIDKYLREDCRVRVIDEIGELPNAVGPMTLLGRDGNPLTDEQLRQFVISRQPRADFITQFTSTNSASEFDMVLHGTHKSFQHTPSLLPITESIYGGVMARRPELFKNKMNFSIIDMTPGPKANPLLKGLLKRL